MEYFESFEKLQKRPVYRLNTVVAGKRVGELDGLGRKYFRESLLSGFRDYQWSRDLKTITFVVFVMIVGSGSKKLK